MLKERQENAKGTLKERQGLPIHKRVLLNVPEAREIHTNAFLLGLKFLRMRSLNSIGTRSQSPTKVLGKGYRNKVVSLH